MIGFPKIGSKIDEIRIDGDLNVFRKDLEQYAAIGLEAVEIPLHGLDVIRNGLLNEKRLNLVLEILRSFDFEYTVHSPNPLNLMEQWNSALHISVFRASLEFTLAIGSNILVYHAGRFIPEETFPIRNENNISRSVALRLMEIEREHLLRLSEEYPNVIICIENARPYLFHSPYCYGERIEPLKEQIEKIGRPNVRVNLDIGHLYMASHFYQFDPVEAVKEVHQFIAHTHIHDNFGGTIYYHEKIQTHQIPFGRGDAHMPVGWGNIPLAEILAAYLPSYQGMLMMELRSRYFDYVKESKENLVFLLQSMTSANRPISRYSLFR
ncbi:MAG: sugar phosphate isomerase/epimerase [Deltaproteobacteria bacterium]|nr:sugar phosphate isomerase/epimerase [Deltaproteobacteria bacterium]